MTTSPTTPVGVTMTHMNLWPHDAATAVAAVVDPITTARNPDLHARIMWAFETAGHDYKAWWLTQHGNPIGQRIMDSTLCDHDTIAWILAAAFHATLCADAPLIDEHVEKLTRTALAWHTTNPGADHDLS